MFCNLLIKSQNPILGVSVKLSLPMLSQSLSYIIKWVYIQHKLQDVFAALHKKLRVIDVDMCVNLL